MLQKICLKNFKCFESLELSTAPLTLLCGVNGAGKSSVLQALLVLRQSVMYGLLHKEGRLLLHPEQIEIERTNLLDNSNTAQTADSDYYKPGSMVSFRNHNVPIIDSIFHDMKISNSDNIEELIDDENEDLVTARLLTDVGRAQDILFDNAKVDAIGFELHYTETSDPIKLNFILRKDSTSLYMDMSNIGDLNESIRDLSPFDDKVVYVDAERVGPRRANLYSEQIALKPDFGINSEYVLSYIHSNRSHRLPEGDPRCSDALGRKIIDVVDYWLSKIIPGTHLAFDVLDIPISDEMARFVHLKSRKIIDASFSFKHGSNTRTKSRHAISVGFGLSYALPVISALLAQPGTLCLIENPEAHLHPSGQTRLAELIVRAALAGVQVIVETHSDHIMDGIRIAVKEDMIKPDDVAFHYFERSDDGDVTVQSPKIDAEGLLSDWPDGFFDQHVDNLARLLAPK